MKRTPLKKRGKKVNEWEKVRRGLVKAFDRAGITRCELRYAGCWFNNALGFAHSLKRRNITTPEQMTECCLCCNICHDQIELLPENEMTFVVQEIIRNRKSPVL